MGQLQGPSTANIASAVARLAAAPASPASGSTLQDTSTELDRAAEQARDRGLSQPPDRSRTSGRGDGDDRRMDLGSPVQGTAVGALEVRTYDLRHRDGFLHAPQGARLLQGPLVARPDPGEQQRWLADPTIHQRHGMVEVSGTIGRFTPIMGVQWGWERPALQYSQRPVGALEFRFGASADDGWSARAGATTDRFEFGLVKRF